MPRISLKLAIPVRRRRDDAVAVPPRRRVLEYAVVAAVCLLAVEIAMHLLYGSPELRNAYRWVRATRLADVTFSQFRERQERIAEARERQGMERSERHPIYGWVFNPGFRLDDREVEIHVNAHGLRGEEFPLVKPEGEIRILCLGGSSTAGEEVREAETYPARLQEILRARNPGLPLRVINGGVPAYAVPDSLRLYELNLSRFGADIVTIYHGINDLFYHRDADADVQAQRNYTGRPIMPFVLGEEEHTVSFLHPYVGALERHSFLFSELQLARKSLRARATDPIPTPDETGIETFERYYRALVRAIEGARAVPVPATSAIAWPGDFDDADRRRIEQSFQPWLQGARASLETGRRILDLENAAIRKVAAEEGTTACEIAGSVPADRRHFVDVCHLTPEGNSRIAELLADRVQPIIDLIRSRSRKANGPSR